MKPDFATNAPRSKRASASFSLVALFLVMGSTLFAGCGDDGNLLGSDGGAGSSGQASGGSSGSSSNAGSGQAGTMTANAGAPGGGTTSGGAGSAGKSGAGGALCGLPEGCAGAAGRGSGGTSSGGSAGKSGSGGASCGIPEGCGGSGGLGSGGQGSSGCEACSTSQTCVAYRTVGGTRVLPDADGMCMTGRHLEGDACQPDFAYTCAELISCTAPAATCHCAPSTQCANYGACSLPDGSAWLDTSAELVCQQLVP